MSAPGGSRWRPFGRLAGGQAVASGLSAAWMIVAARQLGVRRFGELSLVLALAAVMGVVADLGMSLLLTRVGAESVAVDRRLFHSALLLRTVAGLPATGALILLYEASAPRPSTAVPAMAGISLVATGVYSSFTAVLRGRGDVGVEAWNEILSRLALLGGGVWWLSHGGGVLAAVSAYAAVDLVSAAVVPAVARLRIPWATPSQHRPRLREALPLTLASTSGIIYNRIDVWLLALLSSVRQVGLYGMSTKLLDAVLLPARALSALALRFTVSSEAQAEGRYRPGPGTALALGARAVLLTLPAAAALALVARPTVDFVFGPGFRGAVPIVELLMVAALPGAAVLALAPVVAASRPRPFVMLVLASLGVNVVANGVLIPLLQGKGAAAATLIGELGLAVGLVLVAESRSREPTG